MTCCINHLLVEKKVIEVPLPFHLQFVAGAIAGVSEISAMYPLDGNRFRNFLNYTNQGEYSGKDALSVTISRS